MAYQRGVGSYKEILKQAVGGYPFGTPDWTAGGASEFDSFVKKNYKEQKSKLDRAWNASKKSKWEVAVILHEICVSGAYMAYADKRNELDAAWRKENPYCYWRDSPYSIVGSENRMANPANFFVFAKQEYGIGRSDLYNMLAVVEEFGHQDGTMTVEASYFSFSQLVEMLSLTYDERKKVQPSWTVAEIRTYKKSLKSESVQTSGQTEGAEEEPQNERYKRFEKFTRVDLCEKIFSLEEELAACKEELKQYRESL